MRDELRADGLTRHPQVTILGIRWSAPIRFLAASMFITLAACDSGGESPSSAVSQGITSAPPPGILCGRNQTLCGTSCTDMATDTENCGDCGRTCATGDFCVHGRCGEASGIPRASVITPCAPGELLCGSTCVAFMRDSLNCGSCSAACAPGHTCRSGVCEVSP